MVDKSRKSGSEKDSISDQISELSHRIAQYENSQKQLLQIRLGAIFVIVLMMCAFIFGLYHSTTHLDLQEVQDKAVERMTTAAPVVSRYLVDMGQRVLPVYMDTIQDKAREKFPVFIKKTTDEAEEFLLYIKGDMKERVTGGLMDILESQGSYVLQQFPELEDEEATMELAENVQIILSRSLTNVAMEKLDAHLDAVSNIQTKLNRIKEDVKRAPEKNVELKLLAVTLELIGKKLIREIYEVEGGR